MTTQSDTPGEGLAERLQSAYDKVKLWPENDDSGMANLIALRNEGLADKIAADTFNHLRHWQLDEVVTDAFHGAIQKAAAEAIAALGRAQPVAWRYQFRTGDAWTLTNHKPSDRAIPPATGKIEPLYATPPAPQPALALIEAKPLDEWHEDDGFVVWWTLKDGNWLGEPSYIGSPLCDDWPGYHTHWTPHPAFPAPASAKRFKGE